MNHFIRCGSHPLREFIEGGEIKLDYLFRTSLECEYVSELVGDSWRGWDSESPAIISAPTGTGKNRFVEEVLLRHVLTFYRRHGRPLKVLLLQNRTTLRRQTIVRIATIIAKYTGDARYLEALDEYTDTGLDRHIKRLGNIYIATYQSLAAPDGVRLLQDNCFSYIILDEAHFFTSDARFNAETETILRNIVRYGCNATRIYMSATIETAFEPIVREEYEEWKRKKNRLLSPYDPIAPFTPHKHKTYAQCYAELLEQCRQFQVHIYDLESDYRYLDSLHRINAADLLEEIAKGTGHWVVFVSNKKEGQQLCTNLKEKKISAVFLSRESKGSAAFCELVKTETIDARVIIATAVIDNGVNLKDERITDIAVMVFDRVELCQMLGRVRVIKDLQRIRLWVPAWSTEELEKLLRADLRLLVDCLSLEGLSIEERDSLIKAYAQKHKDCFGFNSTSGLHYSNNLLYPLLESIQSVSSILRNLGPQFALKFEDDKPYFARTLKIFYAAANGRLPMSDAVSRTLLGLKLLDDTEYMEAQIPWKRTYETDDSFLYIKYALRIKDLRNTLESRALQSEGTVQAPLDNHHKMRDEDLKKALRRQQKLQQRFGKSMSAWEEVHFWLELDPPKEKLHPPQTAAKELAGDMLMKNSITEDALHDALSENNKCSDKKFLATYGLPKKSLTDLEKSTAKPAQAFIALKNHYQSMLNGAELSITQLMNRTKKQAFVLDDFAYRIESLLSSSNETYYVILRAPIAPC